MKKIAKEVITSLITVILAILAIAIYISSGGKPLFYIALFIALAFGFYNLWLISVTENRKGSAISRKTARSARKKA